MALTRRHALLAAAALAAPRVPWAQSAPAGPAKAALSGRTVEGHPYSLSQDAGKVVMVFFWSTDCAVCRDKLPELRHNYEGWHGKGFQIVGISTDQRLEAVRDYARLLDRIVPVKQRFPMLWRGDPQHHDNFGAIAQTPTAFVLDRSGRSAKVLQGRIPPALWDDIAELVLL